MASISVFGLGYLGLTHAVAMAEMGHTVHGIEPDHLRAASIRSGVAPIYEPGVEELLQKHSELGNLLVWDAPGEFLKDCSVHFLCVGTPQDETTGSWNLDYLFDAFLGLLANRQEGSLVVGKSTVPIGTCRALTELGNFHNFNPENLCWSPEFLQEGTALRDSLTPSRLVVGALDHSVSELAVSLYSKQISDGMPVVKTNWQTAEMAKAAANSYLAMKISFINSFTSVSADNNIDLLDLSKILGLDPRIGPGFLHPGLGYGGGCLPKDIRGFHTTLAEIGEKEQFSYLRVFDEINTSQRARFVELISNWLGGLHGKTIAILGASFKPGTDDLRDSPAMAVVRSLLELGANVRLHDPVALPKVAIDNSNLQKCEDLEQCVAGADLVAITTDWQEYRDYIPRSADSIYPKNKVLDGRNILDKSLWTSLGWELRTLSSDG